MKLQIDGWSWCRIWFWISHLRRYISEVLTTYTCEWRAKPRQVISNEAPATSGKYVLINPDVAIDILCYFIVQALSIQCHPATKKWWLHSYANQWGQEKTPKNPQWSAAPKKNAQFPIHSKNLGGSLVKICHDSSQDSAIKKSSEFGIFHSGTRNWSKIIERSRRKNGGKMKTTPISVHISYYITWV